MSRVIQVAHCIPNEGHTIPESYDNRMLQTYKMGLEEARGKAENRDIRYEFSFLTVGRLLVPFAREKLCEFAMSEGAELIYMVDDDMLGPPDLFFQLVKNVVEGPADVCAALAFTRNPPHLPVIYSTLVGYDRTVRQDYFLTRSVLRYHKDSLMECDAVGFGCVVFKAELLKRMKQPWFMSTTGTGEDVFWCIKAKKEAGARIFCDTRIKLGHLSAPQVVTEATFEACAANKSEMERREKEGHEVIEPWVAVR